jgi:hypothetical protein
MDIAIRDRASTAEAATADERDRQSSAAPFGRWLIYDKDHNHQEMVEAKEIASAVQTAMRGDPKGYFLAIWSGGGWKIGERVKEQEW